MRFFTEFIFVLAVITVANASSNFHNCTLPETFEHGKISVLRQPRMFFYAKCDDGYKLEGLSTGLCLKNEWISDIPKCVRSTENCETLKIPVGGSKSCQPGGFSFGSEVCNFRCGKSYYLTGSPRRECLKNLTWSGEEAQCVPKTPGCDPPKPLLHGTVSNCLSSQRLQIGDECSFGCNPGFALNGPRKLKCRENEELLDHLGIKNLPRCVRSYHIRTADLVHTNARRRTTNTRTANIRRFNHTSHQAANLDCRSNGGCRLSCLTENNKVKEGFKLSADGQTCLDINECQLEPHRCDHQCINSRGSYRCICHPGYKMKENNECEDVDECSDAEEKPCSQICHNSLGSFSCSCLPGYILVDGRKCEGCEKNHYLSELHNACAQCPENSHTDSGAKTSVADCVCNTGFSGNPSENVQCEDIDECTEGLLVCSHKCINTPGSAYCSCPLGLELDHDNKTCIDIDECKISNGGCEGTCKNSIGNFSCSCEAGYSQSKSSRYLCDDIDECAVNNGGCSDICVNYDGGYYCSCSPGYRADGSRTNCKAITCPNVPAPHYSRKHCTLGKTKLEDELQEYQINTVCKFKCFDGFKLDDAGLIQCEGNGYWSGTIPKCIAMTCPPLSPLDHGYVLPPSCTEGLIKVKEKCTYTCQSGYKLRTKYPVVRCKTDLTWSSLDIPRCEPVKSKPYISCPSDVTVELEPLQSSSFITMPEPETNVENYEINPDWVSTGVPIVFPAGRTDVFFSVKNSNKNATLIQCSTTIKVLDKEPPIFYQCPSSIEIENASAYGEAVVWEEPIILDNVGVVMVTKSMEPNTTLTPGVHTMEYVAKDAAGNTATCSFEIKVTGAFCGELANPVNGEANCFDWLAGKICHITCNDGYVKNSNDSDYYVCNDSGSWIPSDEVLDCIRK